ncbi:MAG: 30S ribosomal protein S9 [Myxococcales bacterium]|nr:MAG: 30S ribosomal protein S9 [Myxococcales bacterium]
MTTIHGRHYGTGRRKNAVARVFLKEGNGKIIVNGAELESYFTRSTSGMIVNQPFGVLGKENEYDITCNVSGGGLAAQAEAVRHGISRALLSVDDTFRAPLKKAGLLTRDAREKERKKPGQPGARKKFQYSKR